MTDPDQMDIVDLLRHEARYVDIAVTVGDECTEAYGNMCIRAADEITRLTKELEASRQETAKARDAALEEAAVKCIWRRDLWGTAGGFHQYSTAAKILASDIRALKSNHESNTQGGEG